MDKTMQTDEQLMAALCDDDKTALDTLIHRYQNDVFRFCLHYLKQVEMAKEAAQETYLRIYIARNRFDVTRRFKPWMLCIARNLCINELKRKREITVEALEKVADSRKGGSGQYWLGGDDTPLESAMQGERKELLREALDTLSIEKREIVIMRYYEQMSAREIAEVVDCSEGAVRTRLHRILQELRSEYATLREDF